MIRLICVWQYKMRITNICILYIYYTKWSPRFWLERIRLCLVSCYKQFHIPPGIARHQNDTEFSTCVVSLHRAVRGNVPFFAWTHTYITQSKGRCIYAAHSPRTGLDLWWKKRNLSRFAHNKKRRCDTEGRKKRTAPLPRSGWSRRTWTSRKARKRPSWNSVKLRGLSGQ